MKKVSTLKELTNFIKQEEELRTELLGESNGNERLKSSVVASILSYSRSLKIIESEIIGQHELVLN